MFFLILCYWSVLPLQFGSTSTPLESECVPSLENGKENHKKRKSVSLPPGTDQRHLQCYHSIATLGGHYYRGSLGSRSLGYYVGAERCRLRAWAGNQKLQEVDLRHVSPFMTEILYRRKLGICCFIHSFECMKLNGRRGF